jgi:hypothetical protein
MKKNQIIIGVLVLVLLSIIGTYIVTGGFDFRKQCKDIILTVKSKEDIPKDGCERNYKVDPNLNLFGSKLDSTNLSSGSLLSKNSTSQSTSSIRNSSPTSLNESSSTQPTKTSTPLKFTNEASFEKTVNKKSAEPISEDENGVKTYIVGVPGITTYSKDNYSVAANIITKSMVDADTNNPDQAINQGIINNLDNIITKKSNDVESLQSLYRTGFGGALIKFGADLDGYIVKGLDTQRVYMSLGGQSHPLSPVINILGKKGDEYVWIRTLLYGYDTYPQNLKTQFDNNQNTDFDKMLKIYLDDKGTQNAIKITTSNLTKQFAVVE